MDGAFKVLESEKETSSAQQKDNLLLSEDYMSYVGDIAIPLGLKSDGSTIIEDFGNIPHALVSGCTGSGKTSFVQMMLAVMCEKYTSEEIEICIYDSKGVEYLPFRSVPHLSHSISNNQDTAMEIIDYLEREASNRMELLAELGCKNLMTYNDRCSSSEKKPVVFSVFDDISSLSFDRDEVNKVQNIIKNGRVVGIHLIIVSSLAATKAFQKDLISNVPCKITFRLSSKAESKAILDSYEAEGLYAPGEMIFKYQNQLHRCMCAYSSYENIERAMKKHVRPLASSEIDKAIKKLFDGMTDNVNVDNRENPSFADELIPEAALYIIRSNKASIGYLQRELKIGFSRAARIMDLLADYGVVGQEQGTKPRDILMTEEMWNDFCNYKSRNASGNTAVKYVSNIESIDHTSTSNGIPDKILRPYRLINVGDIKLSVSNNKIVYKKPVVTPKGPGTLTSEIPGDMISRIIYKKPTFISKGYFTFEFKSAANIINNNPDLLYANNNNISDVVKVFFGQESIADVVGFLRHISEDIRIPIDFL